MNRKTQIGIGIVCLAAAGVLYALQAHILITAAAAIAGVFVLVLMQATTVSTRVTPTLETRNEETTVITPDANMLISYCNSAEKTHEHSKKFVNEWMKKGMMYVTDTALAELSIHPRRSHTAKYAEQLKKVFDYCGVGAKDENINGRNHAEISGDKSVQVRKMLPDVKKMYRDILENKSLESLVNMWCIRKKRDREALVGDGGKNDRRILAEAALLADTNDDMQVTLVSMDGDFTLFPIQIRNEFSVRIVDAYELFRISG